MNYLTCIAVTVTDKVMYHKITDHLIYIHHIFDIFALAELFQRLDKPLLVSSGNVCFGVIKNVGIAVRVIVNVLQLYILAAHSTLRHAVRIFETGTVCCIFRWTHIFGHL